MGAVKLAVVQSDPAFGAVRENVAAALALIDGAEADVFVLPELFNTGYNFAEAAEVEALAEPADGPTFTAMTAAAIATSSIISSFCCMGNCVAA